MSSQFHAPTTLPQAKELPVLTGEVGLGVVVKKIPAPAGQLTPVVQPIASRFTDSNSYWLVTKPYNSASWAQESKNPALTTNQMITIHVMK
jgi:hypothetical protein